jgi:hypothetical protein
MQSLWMLPLRPQRSRVCFRAFSRLYQNAGCRCLAGQDADVRLTHYRLQKFVEQQLDLAGGNVVALKPATEVGSGTAPGTSRRSSPNSWVG